MDVTRNEFDDLVGVYALDALDPEEAAAIERNIARDPDAAPRPNACGMPRPGSRGRLVEPAG